MPNVIKINNFAITKISVNFDEIEKNDTALQMKMKATVNSPTDTEDKTMLIIMELEGCPKDTNQTVIEAVCQMIIEFDEDPDDYSKMIEQQCLPAAQKEFLTRINDIFKCMGAADFSV